MHAFEATPLFLMSYLLYTCVALNRLCNKVECFGGTIRTRYHCHTHLQAMACGLGVELQQQQWQEHMLPSSWACYCAEQY